MPYKLAVIMLGESGSGKSTFARTLCADDKCIFSTDDYFMENGVYNFDPTKLGEYHARNLVRFSFALSCGEPVVVCDNTNTQPWMYEKYVQEVAKCSDYVLLIVKMPALSVEELVKRNTHKVPRHAIERMVKDLRG